MNIAVSIYTHDGDAATLVINQTPNSNNYSWTITGDDKDVYFEDEGTIFNYEGGYLGLVGKVLDGRAMYRKD